MKPNKKTGQMVVMLAGALMCAGPAGAQYVSTNTYSFSLAPNPSTEDIPENDPNGLELTVPVDLSELSGPGRTITDVTVSFDISGGYNGDLYSYLAGPNGGFAVLVNRSGVGSASTYGYSDTGFDVTLSDSGTSSIQDYQTVTYSLNGGGQLTGTWQPSGVNIDPQSAPSAFDGAPSTATLSTFDGTNPNGTWTLFLANLEAGNQSIEGPITFTIISVPEPATYALAAAGGLSLLLLRHSRQRRQ